MAYLHNEYFGPTFSTFIGTFKWRYFSGWYVLKTANIRKYLLNSEATTKGHMGPARKHKIHKLGHP